MGLKIEDCRLQIEKQEKGRNIKVQAQQIIFGVIFSRNWR